MYPLILPSAPQHIYHTSQVSILDFLLIASNAKTLKSSKATFVTGFSLTYEGHQLVQFPTLKSSVLF